jgi:hypothetical protein
MRQPSARASSEISPTIQPTSCRDFFSRTAIIGREEIVVDLQRAMNVGRRASSGTVSGCCRWRWWRGRLAVSKMVISRNSGNQHEVLERAFILGQPRDNQLHPTDGSTRWLCYTG